MAAPQTPRAGELNRRIVILKWSDAGNLGFGLDQTFADPVEVWAKHEPVFGLAHRGAAQVGEQPTDLFWVRWAADTKTRPQDLTIEHVIEFDGARYRIVDAIDVNGRHEFTRISTKKLGAI